jgi:hypothetical protein
VCHCSGLRVKAPGLVGRRRPSGTLVADAVLGSSELPR